MDVTSAQKIPDFIQPAALLPPARSIFLGFDLWFDPVTATILHQNNPILLTAREAAILRILLKAPGAWHTASDLARKLKKRSTTPVEAHSIEQTICGLRKKLGESGKQQRILLSHYGHGYRLLLADRLPDNEAAQEA